MNDYRAYVERDYNSIYHHGIKGQQWGVRRYQNEDGSLTPEGRRRYAQDFYNELKIAANEKNIHNRVHKVADVTRKRIGESISDEQLQKLKASEKRFDKVADLPFKDRDEEEKMAADVMNGIKNRMTDSEYERVKNNFVSEHKKKYGKNAADTIANHIETGYKKGIKPGYNSANETFFEMLNSDEKYKKMYWDELKKKSAQYYKENALEHTEYKEAIKELENTKREIVKDILGEYGNKKVYSIYDTENIVDTLAGSNGLVGFYFDSRLFDRKG